MGLSASQARFLQLTGRKSNVEYQAQQINFQRLQLSDKLAAASEEYQDKTSNRKLTYAFNNGDGIVNVDVTYQNYKNYMNQQMDGVTSSQDKLYLVSSSGNKIIVGSAEERDKMIEANTTYLPYTSSDNIKNDDGNKLEVIEREDEDGSVNKYVAQRQFDMGDFMIVDGLEDPDLFQQSIKDGIYRFAKLKEDESSGEVKLQAESWETLGGGAISEDLDKSDDVTAEAEYKAKQERYQNLDKKLELRLNQLETERKAIETEVESVSKVIKDNVESSFKVFS